MDESKEYMFMCTDADEIQQLWKPWYGDYYYDVIAHQTYICSKVSKAKRRFRNGELVWLPRQDQLQKMIKYNSGTTKGYAVIPEDLITVLFHSLMDSRNAGGFIDIPKIYHPEQFCSMEQITLALVMIINSLVKY